jgi:hypothetical protein
MKSRVPEGPRFLRSDGAPSKPTRVHKEQRWIEEVREPEMLHSPSAPLRTAVVELLYQRFLNVVLAEGDKYVGVAKVPKIASTIALWRDREQYVFRILLQPLKRVEEYSPPITNLMGDREVSEIIENNPNVDEYPVVSHEKVTAILPIREIVYKHTPNAPAVTLSSLALPVPAVGSVGEALLSMRENDVPVALVEGKLLDARDVLKRIWESRRSKVGEIAYEDLLREDFSLIKGSTSLKDVLNDIDPYKYDYILIDDEGKVKYIPLGRIASKLL